MLRFYKVLYKNWAKKLAKSTHPLAGVTPKRRERSILSPTYKQPGRAAPSPPPKEKWKSSRVIYDEKGNIQKKVVTYEGGRIEVTDVKTGQTKTYTTPEGKTIHAKDVSIEGEGIKSFSEQKAEQERRKPPTPEEPEAKRAPIASRRPLPFLTMEEKLTLAQVAKEERRQMLMAAPPLEPEREETIRIEPKLPYQLPKPVVGRIEKKQPFISGFRRVTTPKEAETFFLREEMPKRAALFIPVEKKLERFEQITRKVPGVGKPYLTFIPGVVSGLYTTGKAVLTPVKTVKAVGAMITQPRITAQALGERIVTKGPAFVAGEFTGQVYAFRLATKLTPYLPKVRYAKVGEYRGIGIEYRTRAQPLIGVKPGKVVIGTPRIKLKQLGLRKGYIGETALEATILEASLPKQMEIPAEQFPLFRQIVRKTETTPSRFVQEKFITDVKSLTPRQVKKVLEFAREEEAVLYGSFPSRAQMPKELTRVPGDIDVQLQLGAEASAQAAKRLVSGLRRVKGGMKVRISRQKPTLIEAKGIEGKWHHAVDIHSAEDFIKSATSPAITGERVYGFRLGQKPVKIEDIKTMPLSEQGIRKAGSVFTLREKGFAPVPHRIKDIPDFFAVQETLIRSKIFGKPKLMAKLEQLKATFPEEFFKRPKQPVTFEVYRPPSPTTVKPSPGLVIVSPGLRVSPGVRVSPSIGVRTPSPSYPISPPVRRVAPISPSIQVYKPRKYVSPIIKPYPSSKPVKPVSPPSIYVYKVPKPTRYVSPPSPKRPSPRIYKAPSPSKPVKPSSPYYPTPITPKKKPPLIHFPRLEPGKRKIKKLKRKKFAVAKYRPSLVAVEQVIRGKPPPILTGIKVRPIL